jgi:hypothetical protein
MFLSHKAGCVGTVITGMMILLYCSCGKAPTGIPESPTGSVEMQVQLLSELGKEKKKEKTEFDSLIIEISADDMKTIRHSRPIDPEQLFTIDTLLNIPVGSGRIVKVTTVNRAGEIVHEDSAGAHIVKIETNSLTVLSVVLVPVKGSIYLQLAGIPSSVDSVVALFTVDTATVYRTAAARSAKLYMNIDNVAHATKGTLLVVGLSVTGDTLYQARKELMVNARSGTAVQLSLEGSSGGLSLIGSLLLPQPVLVTGSMGNIPAATIERGDLLITEIMYMANDSEYIEVYNPGELKLDYDTLVINIDGTNRVFTDITIESQKYFVLGRSALPWVDITHFVKNALDLSTNGNWITLCSKGGEIIDQVVFAGGNSDLEWPKVNGKQSICLETEAYNSLANNFGKNWRAANQIIEGTLTLHGTPHAR